jgi:hypothetical protein
VHALRGPVSDEAMYATIDDLIEWKHGVPAAAKPLITRHLLALDIIPVLQPRLRRLLAPAAPAAYPSPPPPSTPATPATPSDSAPPSKSNTPTGSECVTVGAGQPAREGSLGPLSSLQKLESVSSIMTLWGNMFAGDLPDPACWRESLRGVRQLLSDAPALLAVAAIGAAAAAAGVDLLGDVACLFQRVGVNCCKDLVGFAGLDREHEASPVARELAVQRAGASQLLTEVLNQAEALPHLEQLVCDGRGRYDGEWPPECASAPCTCLVPMVLTRSGQAAVVSGGCV